MNNNDVIKEWFVFAKRDLDTAKHLYEHMQPRPLEIICYHCQQSAEKALKGLLISKSVVAPRTHDLTVLCVLCMENGGDLNSVFDLCSDLTLYGVQPRYPYEIEIKQETCESALENASKIYNAVFEQSEIV